MLKLKHKHHLDFPHIVFPLTHDMAFSAVAADDDYIANQQLHDDNWQLDERPDTVELAQFWQTVENDVQNDPEWVHFSDN